VQGPEEGETNFGVKERYNREPSGPELAEGALKDWVIREALHNCIAHQDYDLHGRINLVETPSKLILKD
jgi:hypothetical protein